MRTTVLALSLLILPAAVRAQVDETAFQSARNAWEHGDFIMALETYQSLLQGPHAEAWIDSVALATGELFQVREVAEDGRSVRFSFDGRYAAYETGDALLATTHVIRTDDLAEVATLNGRSLRFSPNSSRAVYLQLEDVAEVSEAVQSVQRTSGAGDRRAAGFAQMEFRRTVARYSRIKVLNLETGEAHGVPWVGLLYDVSYGATDSVIVFTGQPDDGSPLNFGLYLLSEQSAEPVPLTERRGFRLELNALPGGRFFSYRSGNQRFVIRDLQTNQDHVFEGLDQAFSSDGTKLAFAARDGDVYSIKLVDLHGDLTPATIARGVHRLRHPTFSPNGASIAFQMHTGVDFEIYVYSLSDGETQRVTRYVQHDIFPLFVTDTLLLTVRGEGRHRRSFLWNLQNGQSTKLFHNNTVRTIAPEYEWTVSADGSMILIVSERDGDTVSPERGVYLVDLTLRVTQDELLQRIQWNLEAERNLRAAGEQMFAPAAESVRAATTRVSHSRLYEYQERLFSFGSKFITEPGNQLAAEYIAQKLREWGYEPELQEFDARDSIPTANVIATLPGTVHPDVVYVVSSHFDSVRRGPGADDNTSGTSVLLETARILADSPLSATVKFAFFTGEEAGLRGSREFMRRAVADSLNIVGALNNDMVGWSGDGRLDNTIRYSNAGIRDVQHAAAFLFSDLVTYDAKYYKFTDAHAYYEVYGDIVGGIGSYPVLGNPNYHQPSDELETVDQDLVAETAKTNIASIMLLASSPSRITGLTQIGREGDTVELEWDPSPEGDVADYVVTYQSADDMTALEATVQTNRIRISEAAAGTVVAVKAVNTRGLRGWDWARLTLD